MNTKRKIISIPICAWLIFLLLFCPSSFSSPEKSPDDVFLSFGMKEVNPANKALSRREALRECLVDAITQYTAKTISQRLFRDNNDILKKRIYKNYNLFLKKYRIKDEQEEDGYYKITAEVALNTTLLLEKLSGLGFVQPSSEKPKLVILVSDIETSGEEQFESSWWIKGNLKESKKPDTIQRKLETRLRLLGFPTMDKSSFLSRLNDSKVSLKRKLIKGDIDILRKFKLGDVLISGRSSVERGRGKDKTPREISFAVSIFNLHDSSKLSTLKKEYNLAQISASLKSQRENHKMQDVADYVVGDFAASMVNSFLNKWYLSGSNTRKVALEVRGLFSYKHYADIKNFLKGLKPDVINFQDAQMEKGLYRWTLEVSRTSETVARKLQALKIEGKRVRILKVAPKNITLELK